MADAKYFSMLDASAGSGWCPCKNRAHVCAHSTPTLGNTVSIDDRWGYVQHPRCFTGKYSMWDGIEGTKDYTDKILTWEKTVEEHE